MAATKKTAATKRTATTKQPAATKHTRDEDVISRLADRSEEALRWLVHIPHRMVGDVRGGVDARLHDLASKLRAIDPLDDRVRELERRLASLEKPARKAARRTPTRAKATATRRASTDRGLRDDAAENTADQDHGPAAGEHEPTR
jgi:hypothetical protein